MNNCKSVGFKSIQILKYDNNMKTAQSVQVASFGEGRKLILETCHFVIQISIIRLTDDI